MVPVLGGGSSAPPSNFCAPAAGSDCGPVAVAPEATGPAEALEREDLWAALPSIDQRTVTFVWDRCPRVGPVKVRERKNVVEVEINVTKGCAGATTTRQWVGATVTLQHPVGQRTVKNVGPDRRHDCD